MSTTLCPSIAPAPGVVCSTHDDGMVLLDVRRGRIYAVNRFGARVWRHVEEGANVDAIAADLVDRFRIPEATAHAHVTAFVARLEQCELAIRRLAS
jgi:hypothetical protein